MLRPLDRTAQFTAMCIAASLVVASTDISAGPNPVSTANVLAIQSLVAEFLEPTSSPASSASTAPLNVLVVQRLLSGVSAPDESEPSEATPTSWALIPAPPRGLSMEAIPVARLLDVPGRADEGRRKQVQPFPPPPLSRVVERYRMMLTPHAPPRIDIASELRFV
ncbi:MAG: hypothetical protein JNK74_23690 [Candidatus Hydrogenedentes bacterium]|nr:hypothetical protein [Candidatus Hydrogenedentota bacterium]